jgi:hypothetical protein
MGVIENEFMYTGISIASTEIPILIPLLLNRNRANLSHEKNKKKLAPSHRKRSTLFVIPADKARIKLTYDELRRKLLMNSRMPRRLPSKENKKGYIEKYDETLLSSLRCHPHFALLSDDQRVLLSKMMSPTDVCSSSGFYVLTSGKIRTSERV